MFKSVLFRPLRKVVEGPDHEPFRAIVDQCGSFIEPWKAWFEEQRRLAARFEQLQLAAGKMFILADVAFTGAPQYLALQIGIPDKR